MKCLQLQVLNCLNCAGEGSNLQGYLIGRVADTSLARPTSRCRRMESIVSLKMGSVHVTK